MTNPKFTIITVVLNNVEHIENTILSVINQTYKNFEFIIIDGCSTDGTLDIINKYKDKVDLLISEKDSGIYEAMNKGIKYSNGEYLNFLNSGDTYNHDYILEKVAIIIKQNKYDLIIGKSKIVGYLKDKFKIIEVRSFDKKYFRAGVIVQQAIFNKREQFDLIGVFDTSYIIKGDTEWLVRYVIKDKINIYLDKNIYCNFSIGGIGSSGNPLVASETFRIGKKYYASIKDLSLIYFNYYVYFILKSIGIVKLKRWLWKKLNI